MAANQNDTVLAVQDAFLDLLELVDSVAEGDESEASAVLRAEAQQTVLMLIAAIVVADGKYEPGEQAFVGILVDLRDKPGGEVSYLNEYAARWAKASMVVPGFFRAAVKHDAAAGTGIAGTMICRIQLIGNSASISDGKFKPAERAAVMRYVSFLADFKEQYFAGIIPN